MLNDLSYVSLYRLLKRRCLRVEVKKYALVRGITFKKTPATLPNL